MLSEECYFSAMLYVSPTLKLFIEIYFLRRMLWVHIKGLVQGRL